MNLTRMKPHRRTAQLAVSVAAAFAIVWLAASAQTSAQEARGLSPQERRGKQIYLKGESDGGEILAFLGAGNLELPASSFPCSNCHGPRGEGGKEGGLQPSPVDWASLSSPHQSPLTRNDRAPYNDATLARAISSGVDASGGRLHPGMPRYKMNAAQMADLIAYLKKLGKQSDDDPGVGEDAVKVGAALPLTGPLEKIGEDVKAALAAYFAEVNAQGGVYGRKLELQVEDSRGDGAGTLDATRRLVEKDGVFALVGSFEPGGNESANEFLKKSEVPLVGPVTLSPRLPAVPNPYVFYMLPTFSDQARALVDFIGSEQTRPKGRAASRIAVVYAGSDFDQDALRGLKDQARLYSMQLVAEQAYGAGRIAPPAIVESLAAKKPDYIFFFGGGDDFTSFAAQMDKAKLDAGLLSSSVMVGRAAFGLPPEVAARTFLSYPSSLPNPNDFKEFLGVMQKAGVSLRSAAFQSLAYGAAKVLVEAMKSTSRQLSRRDLVNALETLRNYRTGVLPPVTFGPNRRVGATGSYIVGIDLGKKQYVPVSDRIVPRGSSQ